MVTIISLISVHGHPDANTFTSAGKRMSLSVDMIVEPAQSDEFLG
jgi:hypothetical protein